jgi:hypothetical protein
MNLEELVNDPKRRKAAARQRTEMLEKHGDLINRSVPHSNFLLGLAREQSALEQLEALKAQEEAGEIGEIVSRDRSHSALNQLAEGYALQGLFEKAIEVVQSPPHRDMYESRAEAMKRIGKRCDCPEKIQRPTPGNAKGETVGTQRLIEEVYYKKRVLGFYVCEQCGAISARYTE